MECVKIERPGGYKRLLVETRDSLPLAPGQVRVSTRACGVNFADVVVRMGLYPSAKELVGWPITPGFEFSGVVTELGEDSGELQLGDEVLGLCLFGAYASELQVPARQLFKKPENLSFEQAGAVAVSFLTASYGLFQQGAARAGSLVLVHSAAGGVGSALVQLALRAGCRVVAVVSTQEKAEALRQLVPESAQADLAIELAGAAALESRLRAHAPRGFDVVLDANGYQTLRMSYRLLRPTGRLVIYGAHSMLSRGRENPNWLKLALTWLMTPVYHPLALTNDNKAVMAFNLSYLFDEHELLRSYLADVCSGLTSGELRPARTVSVPLAEVARAHALLQSGQTIGKIVLIPKLSAPSANHS